MLRKISKWNNEQHIFLDRKKWPRVCLILLVLNLIFLYICFDNLKAYMDLWLSFLAPGENFYVPRANLKDTPSPPQKYSHNHHHC